MNTYYSFEIIHDDRIFFFKDAKIFKSDSIELVILKVSTRLSTISHKYDVFATTGRCSCVVPIIY